MFEYLMKYPRSSFHGIYSFLVFQEELTLRTILEDQGDPERWNSLLQHSIQELNAKHPDLDMDRSTKVISSHSYIKFLENRVIK
jgi:hypothetical protein